MRKMILSLSVAAATIAIAGSAIVLSGSVYATKPSSVESKTQVTGNNGTLKVHEVGTTKGFEDNDPKVCSFNFEGFGFDSGQSGYIVLTTQGKSSPIGENAGPFISGTADSTGYFISGNYNTADGTVIKNGSYKATLYGKDTSNNNIDYTDVKAKSKVFKVDCETQTTDPETPVTPDTDGDSDSNGGKGGDSKATAETINGGEGKNTTSTLPATIPSTGISPLLSFIAMAIASVGAYALTYLRQLKRI